jgi:hypothetical protein
MGGMGMGGMSMNMMPMATMPGYGASMQGMNMGGCAAPAPAAPVGSTAPAAAPREYYCPMHPSVVSSGPGICPYCHMPLQPR